MKLSTTLSYAGDPRQAADEVVALERAGLDTVWVAEAYGYDSPTLMGYLAAVWASSAGVREKTLRIADPISTRSVTAAR